MHHNPFAHKGLTYLEKRIRELANNLPFEVDMDTTELELLQTAIPLCASEMDEARARRLQKDLDQIQRFVNDRMEEIQALLSGVSSRRRELSQYGSTQRPTGARYVYRKA